MFALNLSFFFLFYLSHFPLYERSLDFIMEYFGFVLRKTNALVFRHVCDLVADETVCYFI